MELGNHEVDEATADTSEFDWPVTQKPLQPCHQTLSPTLFADCQ